MASPESATASRTPDEPVDLRKVPDQVAPISIVSSEAVGEQLPSPKSALWRRALSLLWDTADGDPDYRRYVQRLDLFVFPTVCLGYFIKYLDQSNYSNAFVSGMQEDLSLYGNERNWLNTWFALGVMVGSVPAQMSQLKFIRPSILIPCCELIWSCLTIGMGFTKSIQAMYALRFFIGLFEACAFPGYIAILGGWYGPKELTKRLAILLQVESIAGMFSGYLQAGLYTTMNGRAGIAGWRWMFIINAIISFPIGFWGFFGLPDFPHNTRAFYWKPEDIKYGIERIEKFGLTEQPKLTRQELKRIFFGWQLWVFVVPYVMIAACHSASSYFNLWLKAVGYSVVQTNVLPTAGSALNIVVTVTWGILADHTGKYYWLIMICMGWCMLSNVLLVVWDIPKAGLLFSYYISYAGSAATPVLISWGHRLTASDPNLRQLLVAVANVVSYAWVLWVPLVLFPTYDAPKYKYGYQILILFGGIAMGSSTLMLYLHRRKAQKEDQQDVQALESGSLKGAAEAVRAE